MQSWNSLNIYFLQADELVCKSLGASQNIVINEFYLNCVSKRAIGFGDYTDLVWWK